ncbi:MFS transporter [Clostridium manihotivorum]|uniref:MFS transporter n=1 Tax=Clostridium manihotivorum TaxID=2320868 RepID=A0A410DX70_9CLOT|nr:MFS transporter [Clostridium manihotivorum]QAA33664.1 MFS transporter [Clostridium manihotivorum]
MKDDKWKTLVVILVGSFMTTLDINIVNVALPKMAASLYVDLGTIQWVVTSYLLVISTLVLMFGRLADIKGKRIIYQNGFLVFSVGSLLCALSKTMYFLIGARLIQGLGASMMMACNFGIITMIFPLKERGRATGILGTVVAIGTMAGPPLGGFLVGNFSWQSIFLINIPIGVCAYLAGVKLLPHDKILDSNKNFDFKGMITFVISVLALFLSLLNGEAFGWRSIPILIGFLLFIVSFITFCIIEINTEVPMLDFRLFKNKFFSAGILCAFISYCVIYFTNIIQPFYLQHILSFSPQKAGFIMMVYPVTAAIMAPISGVLCDKIGYRIPTFVGLAFTCIGIFTMSYLKLDSSYLAIMISMTILGCGYGLFQSPNNAGVMSSVPKDKLGISGSMNSLIRNLGMTSGISISVAIFYSYMGGKLGSHVSALSSGNPELFVTSMSLTYKVGSVIAIAGIIVAFMRLLRKTELEE